MQIKHCYSLVGDIDIMEDLGPHGLKEGNRRHWFGGCCWRWYLKYNLHTQVELSHGSSDCKEKTLLCLDKLTKCRHSLLEPHYHLVGFFCLFVFQPHFFTFTISYGRKEPKRSWNSNSSKLRISPFPSLFSVCQEVVGLWPGLHHLWTLSELRMLKAIPPEMNQQHCLPFFGPWLVSGTRSQAHVIKWSCAKKVRKPCDLGQNGNKAVVCNCTSYLKTVWQSCYWNFCSVSSRSYPSVPPLPQHSFPTLQEAWWSALIPKIDTAEQGLCSPCYSRFKSHLHPLNFKFLFYTNN